MGKTLEGFEVVGPGFVVTGTDEEQMAAAVSGTKQQIAFYGSTPAYRAVLDLHGWGSLQDELQRAVQAGPLGGDGRADRRRGAHHLRHRGRARGRGARAHRRYGDAIQRISFYGSYASDPDRWQDILAALKAA